MLLGAISDEDRKAKINGLPRGFLKGRQKALDKCVNFPTFTADVQMNTAVDTLRMLQQRLKTFWRRNKLETNNS